jgi:geranylgeranyl reductase family protein
MDLYDVVIVGAGPAGSIAAKNIALKGYKVLLFDKSKFPREKVCAGGLSNKVMSIHPEMEKYTSNKYKLIQAYAGSYEYPFRYRSENGLGYQTTREYFDHMLVKDAITAGANFKEQEKIVDIIIESDKVVIVSEKAKYAAKIVLGADGTSSIVGKKTGINPFWKKNQIASHIRMQIELPEALIKKYVNEDYPLSFHSNYRGTPGIGYIYPKKNHINVGICTQTPERLPLRDLLDHYISDCQEKKLLPPFKPSKYEGSIYPICGPLKKIYCNRAMLLGDAAGFTNPFDGEGIYQAIYSGDIAAEVTIDALKANDFSEGFLKKYQGMCMKAFGNALRKAAKLAPISWKHSSVFVKIAPYSENVVRLYRKAINIDDSIYWTLFKLTFYFIGATFKYVFKRKDGLLPIIEV